jgi:hypothetical protein
LFVCLPRFSISEQVLGFALTHFYETLKAGENGPSLYELRHFRATGNALGIQLLDPDLLP